jgi:phosphoribosylformylglycinamidine synthase II
MSLVIEKKQSEGHRFAVCTKEHVANPHAIQLEGNIRSFLNLDIEAVKIKKVFTINKEFSPEQLDAIASNLFVDPILEETAACDEFEPNFSWSIEIGPKPGVTDNTGNTAQITIEDFIGSSFIGTECVRSSTQYLIKGELSFSEVNRIAEELLANKLIEAITISKNGESERVENAVKATEEPKERGCYTQTINLNVPDKDLLALSKQMGLALSLEEMKVIQNYYKKESVREERQKHRMPEQPTDVELEALAQTWSEHCKHKIFNATIHFEYKNKKETIHSLFKTYIKAATDILKTKRDWLVSVFSDNAGIIKLNYKTNIAFKVETHNSPSALDPYGGALTGILGVNRDIMGAGIGARLLANTDIFCFAPPNYNLPIPKRLLHPKRIFEGVRRGVEHGGNKSGVPTINGAIVFDESFLGKPLVYCGSVGIMPKIINGKESHLKEITPNDLIVVAGGRTGRDGIHGATFSSEELHADSPSSAVQIGDPFTQKKLHDFLLEARDLGLYRTLTDNGAGGFSSSVGELAQLSGGCEIHLDKVVLKTSFLEPWEILLSESQERMTLAVPKKHFEALQQLAKTHEVEITKIGTFTETNRFVALYNNTIVALLDLKFMHEGLPPMELTAEWTEQPESSITLPEKQDLGDVLKKLLARFNICSKESIIRQYDHEVQGGSSIKPLTGAHNDGPSDAAIIRPIETLSDPQTFYEGIVVSNGICPKFSSIDTYHMAASAIDEAIRNFIAVGGNPNHLAILDNFCWPDPIYDPIKTPDGKHKLAQLVRANQALYNCALDFEVPIISGKDSMKNDYKIDDTKISILPTLLISAIGKIQDVRKAISMDFKMAGDYVYILGTTHNELGGSEYALEYNIKNGFVPKVDAKQANEYYRALYACIENELIASCHDCSDGGLAVAIAESAFAGNLGIDFDLSTVPKEGFLNYTELLFSESNSRFILSVSPENAREFERHMEQYPLAYIGTVTEEPLFTVKGLNGSTIINENILDLKKSWQSAISKGGAS